MAETQNLNLTEEFDFFAGTSTGAIIASGLACGIPPEKILELYIGTGEDAFKKKFSLSTRVAWGAFHSVYHSEGLRDILKSVLKDVRLGDISSPLLITALDVTQATPHNFRSGPGRDEEIFLWQAVLASCSAPIYFDPMHLRQSVYSDGGIWASNPSLTAVFEACDWFQCELKDLKLLSFGTGFSKSFYAGSFPKNWGFLKGWKQSRFLEFCASVQSVTIHSHVKNLFSKISQAESVLRINFEMEEFLSMDDTTCIPLVLSRADQVFEDCAKEMRAFFL